MKRLGVDVSSIHNRLYHRSHTRANILSNHEVMLAFIATSGISPTLLPAPKVLYSATKEGSLQILFTRYCGAYTASVSVRQKVILSRWRTTWMHYTPCGPNQSISWRDSADTPACQLLSSSSAFPHHVLAFLYLWPVSTDFLSEWCALCGFLNKLL